MSIQFDDIKLAIIAVFKRKKLIAAVTLLGALIALLVVTLMPVRQVYSSRASVYSATYGSYQETMDGVDAMVNYADVATSMKVCQRAASTLSNANLTAKDVQSMITTTPNTNGYILYVEANTDSPELSTQVANAVANSFVVEISNITGANSVQLLDEASVTDTYVYDSTSKVKVFIMIVGISFAAICAYILLRELFSGKVKSVEQCVESDLDEVIGIIPIIER